MEGSAQETAAGATPRQGARGRWRVLLSSYIGSLIEWYDFYLYGAAAVVFAPLFFLFTTTTRYTGASLGYQLAASIGGGFGPLIAASLLAAAGGPPNTLYVSLFMAATCVATLIGVFVSRETYRADLTKMSSTL